MLNCDLTFDSLLAAIPVVLRDCCSDASVSVLLSQVLDFFRVDPRKGLSDDQVRLYLIQFEIYDQ